LTWDHGALPALPLFLSCRAAVRAHVAISGSDAGSPARQREALALLRAALVSLAPGHPQIVAIGGASGTGKSTLAYGLAPALPPMPGAITIRSDLVRKKLHGASAAARLPVSAYTPQVSARVYATMARMMGEIVRAGYSVVVDAVFGQLEHRQQIEAAAHTAGYPFTGFWLEALTEEFLARVSQRRGDASDATAEILTRQLGTIQPPRSWARLDAGNTAVSCLAQAEAILSAGAKSSEA
jgi:predicted kinase